MKSNKDFDQVDRAASREILKDFSGKHVEEQCNECKGSGSLKTGTLMEQPCENCQGTGSVTIEY